MLMKAEELEHGSKLINANSEARNRLLLILESASFLLIEMISVDQCSKF